MKAATIKDIATVLNLSTSTVSRGLNDHPDISTETKRKINEIATKIRYEPNVLARKLRSKYNDQLGIIVPNINSDLFFKVFNGIEDIAYKNGFTISVTNSNDDSRRERNNLNTLYSNRINGMMISLSQSSENLDHLQQLLKKGVKIVQFDQVSNDLDTHKVIIDEIKVGYDVANHLIDKGYRNILYLGEEKISSISTERLIGIEKALIGAGIIFCKENIIEAGICKMDGEEAIQKLLDRKVNFDAIFCVNDFVALGASTEIKKRGLRIPKDIAIVGFSNSKISEHARPPLTSVEQPAYEMGKILASVLLSEIKNGKKRCGKVTYKLKCKLIVREST